MSLRVWLPLNGDLTNNGLSDISITNSSTVTNANGKLGRCYYFNGNSSYLKSTDYANLGDTFSICAWVKLIGDSRSDGLFCDRSATYGGFTIYFYNGIITIDPSAPAYSTSTRWTTNVKLNANTWYHIAVIRTSTSINVYVDGRLQASKDVAFANSFGNCFTIGGFNTNGVSMGTMFYGYMNDFRIYDHALSPKEIKLLSQGLVCHYKLSDPYIESTTNTVTSTDCLSATCYNGARRKYGYGENTDMYKTMGFFEGKYCTKVYMGTSGELANPYPYINGNAAVSDGTNAPEYKTVSFDYFGTIGTYIQPYKLGDGSATCTWTNKSASTQTGTYTNNGQIPVVPNKWNHITMVLHGTTAANANWGYIILGAAHTSDTTNYWLFANLQIEEKDHETPYAGVGGTRNENIVYDSSGYNHHGNIVTSGLVASVNSPRNNICTYFNGTAQVSRESISAETKTISFWIKAAKTASTVVFADYKSRLSFGFNGGKSIIVRCVGNAVKMYDSSAFIENSWNHIALVQDNTSSDVLLYINGMLQTNRTASGDFWSHQHDLLTITGRDYSVPYKMTCYLSDFRLYATALSQEDIQELYNAPVSVANTGAMLTQGEFVEVTT